MAEARSPVTDRLTPEGNRTGSPLRLTETGREIAKLTDAGAWSGRRAVEMKEDARGLEAWRVDELCKARVATDEGEMRTAMRKAAYEAGVAIGEVEAAVSLVLRNAVIDELAREGAWPGTGRELA